MMDICNLRLFYIQHNLLYFHYHTALKHHQLSHSRIWYKYCWENRYNPVTAYNCCYHSQSLHHIILQNLSFQNEADLLIPFGGHQSENDKAEWRGMQLLANHANVGLLKMRGKRDEWRGWSFSFAAGSLYFSHWVSNKKAEAGFTLHDKNLIEKRRIGNF